ncbi:MAG: hypothetical protein ACREN2_05590 [Candidatus Dormibacteria bacterium]
MAGYSFGSPNLPIVLRTARALLALESALLVLAGLFAVLLGLVLGSGNTIPFAGAQVGGAGAAALGFFYGLLGLAALYTAIEMGRLTPWTRVGTVVLQAGLIVLFLARGDLSVSTLVSVALCLAVVGLVLTPTATTALTSSPSSSKS